MIWEDRWSKYNEMLYENLLESAVRATNEMKRLWTMWPKRFSSKCARPIETYLRGLSDTQHILGFNLLKNVKVIFLLLQNYAGLWFRLSNINVIKKTEVCGLNLFWIKLTVTGTQSLCRQFKNNAVFHYVCELRMSLPHAETIRLGLTT